MAALEQNKAGDRVAFALWLMRRPAHVQAYLALTGFMPVLDRFFDHIRPDVEATRSNRSMRWAAAGLAATVVLAAGAWYVYATRASVEVGEFTTGIGEHRMLILADGSTIHLNTQSRLVMRFSSSARDLTLTAGEALFIVAANRNRPFRVFAGDAIVQAVGTRFNVDTRADRMVVDVLEGTVQLALTGARTSRFESLSAGESMEILRTHQTAELRVRPISEQALQRRVSWTTGVLSFERERLDNVIDEFNRYNRQQMRLTDPTIAGLEIGGQFKATNIRTFVGALEKIAHVKAQWPPADRPDGVPILLRGTAATPVVRENQRDPNYPSR